VRKNNDKNIHNIWYRGARKIEDSELSEKYEISIEFPSGPCSICLFQVKLSPNRCRSHLAAFPRHREAATLTHRPQERSAGAGAVPAAVPAFPRGWRRRSTQVRPGGAARRRCGREGRFAACIAAAGHVAERRVVALRGRRRPLPAAPAAPAAALWSGRGSRRRAGRAEAGAALHPRLVEELLQGEARPRLGLGQRDVRHQVRLGRDAVLAARLSRPAAGAARLLRGGLRGVGRQLPLAGGRGHAARGLAGRAHRHDVQRAGGGLPAALRLHEVLGRAAAAARRGRAAAGRRRLRLRDRLRAQGQRVVQHVRILAALRLRHGRRLRRLLLQRTQNALHSGRGRRGVDRHHRAAGARHVHVLPHHPPRLQLVAADRVRHQRGHVPSVHVRCHRVRQ